MDLVMNLKSWFLSWDTRKDNTTNETIDTTAVASFAAVYEQLFTDLQHVCTRLPEAKHL